MEVKGRDNDDMKETSTDYVPEGYVQDDYSEDPRIKGKIMELPRIKRQEPFKLTEEEYQWLISLCCRGQA